MAVGREFLSINPEFGPPPHAPSAGKPFIDIWEACRWMTRRFREHWCVRLENEGAPGRRR